ncbi:Spy/CpxP family protein refolding chaperone [Chitinibacter bivalviorum]|uniref:Spy/CpxP family protein refolding chaperone n=1 Tax=Chitinibacter bivalviorum TaxID=2739434 RepID=A0A7H9BKR5_9NEIS|nr:Spy/CpxP family protein refolding chaperone [Chitinibacter bivalviorum]QLG88916.1 Spy/CpxP family protein refolding chaperone [Chitinibacter bivalviorum]
MTRLITNHRKAWIALALALGIASAGYAAQEQMDNGCNRHTQQDGMRQHGRSPMLRGIDLSDAQQAQIKALQAQNPRPEASHMATQQSALMQLVTAPQFDKAKAESLINAQHQQMSEHMLAHLAMEQKIYALLTPAQQEQAKQNLSKMPHGPRHPD